MPNLFVQLKLDGGRGGGSSLLSSHKKELIPVQKDAYKINLWMHQNLCFENLEPILWMNPPFMCIPIVQKAFRSFSVFHLVRDWIQILSLFLNWWSILTIIYFQEFHYYIRGRRCSSYIHNQKYISRRPDIAFSIIIQLRSPISG